MIKVSICVRANKKWNELQKNKHPFLWNIGLVTKSKDKKIELGVTESNERSDLLFDFLNCLSVNVEKL